MGYIDYKDFEIPKDLRFKMEDILAMNGYQCSVLVEAKHFSHIFTQGEKLKKLTLDLKFSVLSKEVLVQGAVEGILEVTCARCLKKFNKNFFEPLSALTSRKDKIIDIMYITEQTLPLVSGIQNLCSENCKGLCPQCGINLNEHTCNCKGVKISPFACLKDKFSKK